MASASTLRRDCLSLLESVAQAVGTIGPSATMGTVIPLLIGKSAGSSLLLFAVIIGVYFFIANIISAFASRHVSAGSLSAYARLGLGRGAGIVVGWSYIIAMVFVVASSAVSCAYYIDAAIVRLSGQPENPLRSVLVTAAILVTAWWPARKDIRFSTKLMLTAELVSVVMVVAILLLALFRSGLKFDTTQFDPRLIKFSDGRLGFVLAFMMLAGFESTTTLSEETKGAAHSIPRAMLTCLIPVGLLYLVSIYGLRALSQKYSVALDQAALPFDTLAGLIGLPFLGWISSAGIALSCYTCIIAGLNAGSRIVYAMSRRGDLPSLLSRTAVSTGNPVFAVNGLAGIAAAIALVVLGCRVTLSQGIDFLVQLASLGFLGAYLGVGIAAPIYLSRQKLFTPAKIFSTCAALLAVICATVFSIYPLAPAPWCYLPLTFAGFLIVGAGWSFFYAKAVPAAPLEGEEPVESGTR